MVENLRGQASSTCVAWPACAVVCSFSVDAACIWCALHGLAEALVDVHIAVWALKSAQTPSRAHICGEQALAAHFHILMMILFVYSTACCLLCLLMKKCNVVKWASWRQ